MTNQMCEEESDWRGLLCLNDWDRRSFLIVNIATIVVLVLSFLLSDNGIKVPFLREASAIVLITLLPGFSIMKLARIYGLCAIKTLALAISISILITMCTGTLLDILGMHFGISAPLTEERLILANSAIALILAAFSYLMDRNDRSPLTVSFPKLGSIELLLIAFPFLAFIAATYTSRTGDGSAQLLLYLCVAVMGAYLGIGRQISPRVYPLAVFCLALTLLLQSSLTSRYMVEWADVSFEFWSSKQVILNGWWDPTEFGRTNSVLSITILAPTYALVSGMDLITVFKIVFPLLFCIVPLITYEFARKISMPQTAFLVAFLLIGSTCFYNEMLGLNRQIVAEVFMACFIMVLLMDELDTLHKGLFLSIFTMGITFSHYGLMMIFAACLIFAGGSSFILNRLLPAKSISKRMIVGFTAFIIVMAYVWYNLVINSMMFRLILRVVDQLLQGLAQFHGSRESVIFKIFNMGGLNLTQTSMVLNFYFILLFSIVGLAVYALRIRRGEPGRTDYLTLSIAFLAIITAGAYSPNIFNAVSEERLYHISLIVLAPLLPLGLGTVIKRMSWKFPRFDHHAIMRTLLTVFVVASFLFYSGAVSSMIGQPTAFPLDPKNIDRVNFVDGEYLAVMWGSETMDQGSVVYGDAYQAYLAQMNFGSYGPLSGRGSVPFESKFKEYYFLLGSVNVHGYMWLEDARNPRLNKSYEAMPSDFVSLIYSKNLVYCSQEAKIFYHRTI